MDNPNYSNEWTKKFVRIRCANCQYEADSADFLQQNSMSDVCPRCQQKKCLILIMDNGREINMAADRPLMSNKTYIVIALSGFLIAMLYKTLPFEEFLPTFIFIIIFDLVLAFRHKK